MTMTSASPDYFRVAPDFARAVPDFARAVNDDVAEIVPAHLAAQRMERRLMLGTAILAAVVLISTMLHGWSTLVDLPDVVTFAFRV